MVRFSNKSLIRRLSLILSIKIILLLAFLIPNYAWGDRFGNENISLRGRGSVQAAGDEVLWDIDGVTFQSPPMLSVNEVVYVEIIKGLSATNKYGSDGAAGVIIVKTSVNASNYDLINSPKNLWRTITEKRIKK